jgi:hypothetical protein
VRASNAREHHQHRAGHDRYAVGLHRLLLADIGTGLNAELAAMLLLNRLVDEIR